MSSIKWNSKIKLILADVDETIADVYMPADAEIIKYLEKLLNSGKILFLVSGGGLHSICERVVYLIGSNLRKNIIVSHCSGAEVWGFKENGDLNELPFYSIYEDKFDEAQKKSWRTIVDQIIKEFNLETYETMPVIKFKEISHGDPLSVMLSDRGPQITLEVVNGYNLTKEQIKKLHFKVPKTHGSYDIRVPIATRAVKLFQEIKLPVDARLEGVFALNFPIEGISKQTSIEYVLNNTEILNNLQLTKEDVSNPVYIEIWGDKFSDLGSKRDSLMSRSVSKAVRSIDFRQENMKEFPEDYNIVVWDGKQHLHNGLLEYLQSAGI